MRKLFIIGMTADFAGAGKDAAADIICEDFGYQKIAFADAVKTQLELQNPLVLARNPCMPPVPLQDRLRITPWDELKNELWCRTLLQHTGTEAGWMFHGKDLWTNLLQNKLNLLLAEDTNEPLRIIVTDIRFDDRYNPEIPGEAALIRRNRGKIIKILGDPSRRRTTGSTASHSSETTRVDADITIANHGTLDDLRNDLNTVVEDFEQQLTDHYQTEAEMDENK